MYLRVKELSADWFFPLWMGRLLVAIAIDGKLTVPEGGVVISGGRIHPVHHGKGTVCEELMEITCTLPSVPLCRTSIGEKAGKEYRQERALRRQREMSRCRPGSSLRKCLSG